MYKNRVLAYIDILGFKSTIEKTMKNINGKETENVYETQKIDALLDETQWQLKYKDCLIDELIVESKVTSQFSDTIIISYLKSESIHRMFLDVYFLCTMALERGFILRGAIVYGKVHHTEKKIFGPALVRAHEMESSIAKFPRIIIDKNVLDMAKENCQGYPESKLEYNELMKLVLYDSDDIPFINYIDKLDTGVDNSTEAKKKHLLCLNDIIQKMDVYNNNINDKYLWLKNKYNSSLAVLNTECQAPALTCGAGHSTM